MFLLFGPCSSGRPASQIVSKTLSRKAPSGMSCKCRRRSRRTLPVPDRDADLLRENEQLRKENRILREEKEVLKKAAQFFAAHGGRERHRSE